MDTEAIPRKGALDALRATVDQSRITVTQLEEKRASFTRSSDQYTKTSQELEEATKGLRSNESALATLEGSLKGYLAIEKRVVSAGENDAGALERAHDDLVELIQTARKAENWESANLGSQLLVHVIDTLRASERMASATLDSAREVQLDSAKALLKEVGESKDAQEASERELAELKAQMEASRMRLEAFEKKESGELSAAAEAYARAAASVAKAGKPKSPRQEAPTLRQEAPTRPKPLPRLDQPFTRDEARRVWDELTRDVSTGRRSTVTLTKRAFLEAIRRSPELTKLFGSVRGRSGAFDKASGQDDVLTRGELEGFLVKTTLRRVQPTSDTAADEVFDSMLESACVY